MIENVLEIKDTLVREVMTPLVDVVAIDATATLIDFRNLWETHQYSRYFILWPATFILSLSLTSDAIASRVPVFEERIDNIVGIAYAMDMLEYVEEVCPLITILSKNLIVGNHFVCSKWKMHFSFEGRETEGNHC
jgi:CBS domain containing-hemolysin-like protein